MDPNETLRLLRQFAREFKVLDEQPYGSVDPDDYIQLADNFYELFTALDQWLSKGGFSPWETPKREVVPGTFAFRKILE